MNEDEANEVVKSFEPKEELEKFLAEFEVVRVEMEEKVKQIQVKMQEASKDLFSRFWEENPKVHVIIWTQYTPYFNDGETCTFRVGEMYPMTEELYTRYVEDDGYEEEYSILDWNGTVREDISDLTEIEATKISEIIKILSKIPEEVYMGMFGDHCKITATREGFQVDEYEHE